MTKFLVALTEEQGRRTRPENKAKEHGRSFVLLYRGGYSRHLTCRKFLLERPTERLTDRVTYRVVCTRLIMSEVEKNIFIRIHCTFALTRPIVKVSTMNRVAKILRTDILTD